MTYVLRLTHAALLAAVPLYAAGPLLLWLGHAGAAPVPTVTAAAFALGPSVDGTAISISGSGFVAGVTVTIGGTPATSVVAASATTITATTPARPIGAADVGVTNVGGQFARWSRATRTPPPSRLSS